MIRRLSLLKILGAVPANNESYHSTDDSLGRRLFTPKGTASNADMEGRTRSLFDSGCRVE
jgi:hypothetical protein